MVFFINSDQCEMVWGKIILNEQDSPAGLKRTYRLWVFFCFVLFVCLFCSVLFVCLLILCIYAKTHVMNEHFIEASGLLRGQTQHKRLSRKLNSRLGELWNNKRQCIVDYIWCCINTFYLLTATAGSKIVSENATRTIRIVKKIKITIGAKIVFS